MWDVSSIVFCRRPLIIKTEWRFEVFTKFCKRMRLTTVVAIGLLCVVNVAAISLMMMLTFV